jgi:hypothetical protein
MARIPMLRILLVAALPLLLNAQPVPTAATTKQRSPKGGMPGVTPQTKAGTLTAALQMSKLRAQLTTWACAKAEHASSIPCSLKKYSASLKTTTDAAAKQKLIDAHKAELTGLSVEAKKARADSSWASMKVIWTSYCAEQAASKVCTNALLKKTYTAEKRPTSLLSSKTKKKKRAS